ncbi:MAG: NAD-dependent epimerase/dehydratase family protein [Actinomycetota bacterium]|nr:NAD-dependent epimerase/dehydratase family protein [Actinomycetota bacterium]
MRVALTGGSGVVGGAVLRHLVEAGHEVKALARLPRSGAAVTSLGATPVPGDVLSPRAVRELVDGCEVVFHVAGVNEMCSADPNQMWRVNVEGTRVVMDSCRDAGVARLVHTSSAVTIGEGHGEVGRESSAHRGFFLSKYEETKTEAELLISEARGLDVVAVNPSSVQGPGRATGTGKLFLAAARGALPFAIDATISMVDIDDCARGHLLAATEGQTGERYLLSGVALTIREAVRLLGEAVGSEIKVRYLNPKLLAGVSWFPEILYKALGRQAPICREAVRVMTHDHNYDGSRAVNELGLEYTPVTETIARTVAWFRDEGLLD